MSDYGFAPSFVIRIGEKAPKFIEILDWHAAVKYFVNSTSISCDTQNFFKEFEPFKASFEGRGLPLFYAPDALAEMKKLLKEHEDRKCKYKILKRSYDGAYKLHKER